MTDVVHRNPFAAAPAYREKGWEGTVPVAYEGKTLLVKSFTGRQGKWPTDEQVARRIAKGEANGGKLENIALRLPAGIVGVDVDDYGEKKGAQSLRELEAEYGELPETARSSARGFDGAGGIRLFRLPAEHAGAELAGAPADGIEIIQFHHRYAIVWPSVHPKTKTRYEWESGEIPELRGSGGSGDLAELPVAWVTSLRSVTTGARKNEGVSEAGEDDVKAYFEAIRDGSGQMCRAVERMADRLTEGASRERGNAHDAVNRDILALIEMGYQGHRGVASALGKGRRIFVETASDRSTKAELTAEWRRMAAGALAIKQAEKDGRGREMEHVCACDHPGKLGPFGEVVDDTVPGTATTSGGTVGDDGGGSGDSGEQGDGDEWGGGDAANLKAAHGSQPNGHPRPAAFFDKEGLKTDDLVMNILASKPAALTAESKVAVYDSGVFAADGEGFNTEVAARLRNRYRPSHVHTGEGYARAVLNSRKTYLPTYSPFPAVNVRNGMVDLLTGELKDHHPDYLSSAQLPVEWDPDARSPHYEAWIDGIGVSEVLDDLEEVCSAMLDPTRTPQRAGFLYGPSRSGKSTYLRLMQAIAGASNCSAVTMHQLADDRFAAANVYGRILNSSADLSDAHVKDLSLFKMMTGEDVINGNRKYGRQFTFTNRALFLFSANTLPTVGDDSDAYTARIKPFRFNRSFRGSEDPRIEDDMMAELPGILVRLVAAWQRLTARGHYLATDADVMEDFSIKSNRVYQWFTERCDLHPIPYRTVNAKGPDTFAKSQEPKVPENHASTKRLLASAFNRWADENEMSKMGSRKIIERLTCIDGVVDVRFGDDARRGLNVTLRDMNPFE
jgi:P4 family phage/plasmid primase-like protien